MNKAPYRFLRHGLLVAAPVLIFMLGAEGFLWLSGETVPVTTVARETSLSNPPALYSPLLVGSQSDLYHYLHLRERRPEILVLGSSRVWRFHREMFGSRTDFYNCSGLVDCVATLEGFIRAVPKSYAPKVMLIGVDHWWFSASRRNEDRFTTSIAKDDTKSVTAHLYAYQKLVSSILHQQVSPRLMVSILNRKDDGLRRFGLRAWRSEGYSNDGSLRSCITNLPRLYARHRFSAMTELIKRRPSMYSPACEVDDTLLNRFAAALSTLQERGTQIVGFAPPVASDIRQLYYENPTYYGIFADYETKIPQLFRDHRWGFFDGSNPRTLGLDDNVMEEDGCHGEDSYHIGLLQHMAADPALRAALNLNSSYLANSRIEHQDRSWEP